MKANSCCRWGLMERVLIADDEPKVCQLICELIDWGSLDMEIAGTANDGIKALEMTERLRPDIIITDIRMPGYDGLELINRIKETGIDSEIIIISGYSHFEYARRAIKYGIEEYLLKPVKKEELHKTLLKLHEKIKQKKEQLSREEQLQLRIQNDMKKLRSGFISDIRSSDDLFSENATQTINEMYHFTFKPGCFQVVAIKIDYAAGYEKCLDVLKPKSVRILEQFLKPLCFDMEIFTEKSTVYCFLNFDDEDRKTIRKKLKTVLDELLIQSGPFDGINMTLCAGGITDDINRLKDSLESTDFAVKERIITGTEKLIEDVPVKDNGMSLKTLLSSLNKSLSAALEILDLDGVMKIIDSARDEVLSKQRFNGWDIFQLTGEICDIYLVSMRNNKFDVTGSEHFTDDFRASADGCGTAGELFKLLAQWIGKSLGDVIELKKSEVTRPIRLAKKYIHENYMSPITLEEVSEVAGFNPSYFSTLFKKETGSNFMEYLSKLRMDKARDLLKETGLSVSAICEEVGYLDLKYFTKSFKKATGLKPNEYRKLYS